MDGERSRPPAGQEGGYVPPDLVSTQQFWTIPADGQTDRQTDGPPESTESTTPGRQVAPAEDAVAARRYGTDARPLPIAAAAPPRLPPAPPPSDRRVAGSAQAERAPGRALGQAGSIEPAEPRASLSGPARKSRHGRNMMAAVATAAGVVVIGAGVAVLWPGDASKPAASGDRTSPPSASSAPARTQSGAPSPAAAGQPLTQGRVVSYTTMQREQGYFEGVLTLTNRTGAPLSGWQVSFTYPGAYVKSVWGGVLVHAGTTATIRGTAPAASIPAGGTVRIRFGASGTPSAPRGCTLNGGPC